MMKGRNDNIGLVILIIFISLFVVIIVSIFNKETKNNKNRIEKEDLDEYDIDYQFNEISNELKNLSFEDRKLLCEYMEQDPFNSSDDTKKLHDACLLNYINFDIYDERLCSLMYGVLEDTVEINNQVIGLSYKQHCYAKIAIKKGDISYCKGQGEACILLSETEILNSQGEVACENLLANESEYCNTNKINTKYGIFLLNHLKSSGYDSLYPEVYEYIKNNSMYRLNKFGTVENLCNSFVNDLKDVLDIGTNESYNRCINLYMENMNQNNIEHCRKLKYSEIESKNGITLTEKDLCLSHNIIDKTKNIKDCQFADYNHICVSLVAHELGDSTNCDILSSSSNRELCYEFSGKEPPVSNKLIFRDNCLIKGNISYDNGEKIYHLPGCEYYDETVINPTYGERRFCTEQEAINAGWRKAKNCY